MRLYISFAATGSRPVTGSSSSRSFLLRTLHAQAGDALLLSAGQLKIAAVCYIVDAEPLHILGAAALSAAL